MTSARFAAHALLCLWVGGCDPVSAASSEPERRGDPAPASAESAADEGPSPRPKTAQRGLPYYADATFTPHWFPSPSAPEKGFHRIPSFVLQNQNGEEITEETFSGKLYVANFFFTTCAGICATMTKNLLRVQQAFGQEDDVRILSHSVTPEIDKPSVLKKYAERYGCDSSKWHLATGEGETILALGRRAYFVEEDRGLAQDTFLHSENLILVDRQRHIRGVYNGLKGEEVAQLIQDIRQLLRQPS